MKVMIRIGLFLLCLPAAGATFPALAVDEARQAYDKMVEEATREADEYLQEKQEQHKATAADRQATPDNTLEQRIRAERQRILTEMDTVRGRGLGPNFTQGMKDNLLQELQEKLGALMSDPEAYFSGH